jgi:hypothetical protein
MLKSSKRLRFAAFVSGFEQIRMLLLIFGVANL